ncbi:hypothetical protein ACFU5O_32880 [Streptomyces sp. NPDC057445]|uniref:hypothetical protein n=1 Tax=Streptomyces sp. NPDC057445 TaxID=3346136 RepID=UPI00367EC030
MSESLSAGPYGIQLGTSLAPGQSEPVKILVTDDVDDGPWDVSLQLKSGLLEETYKARITFPHSTGVAGAVPTGPGGADVLDPTVLAVSAALVTLFAVVLGTVLSRRRRGSDTGS